MSRHQRIETLFEECLALPAAERRRFLEARCTDDATLIAEVMGLLELDSRPDTPSIPPLLAPPATGPAAGARAAGTMPEWLGPYRVGERLGEGGFGEVYAADQSAPIRRRVAIKILKAGLDTRAVLARFEAERQALALMDHPHVAKVFDAGETPAGRPYFVMELVTGESITSYCDRHGLAVRERLELFVTVCRAVEHAHQKGVIHRDLKPSNILVSGSDGRPHARVIDFGIAKATTASLGGGATLETRPGEFLGTPEYMSPEQASSGGVDIDTRSDVYSLGVVLYRLLAGRLPFESARLRGASLGELQRILEEEEPPKPSENVSRVRAPQEEGDEPSAPTSAPTSATALRDLRGDLDWIVLKAMSKERARRYASPAALADDIERHLRDEPVEAGPLDTAYRLRKLVRRHRGAFAGASLVLLVLLAGIVTTTLQAVRAGQAEAEASRQARSASAVNAFLTRMLSAANPETNPRGLSVTVREVVDGAASEFEGSRDYDPETEAGIRQALGSTYQGLGLYDAAAKHARRALEIRKSLDAGSRETLEQEVLTAAIEAKRGHYAEAEERLGRLVPRAEAAGGELRSRFLQARGGNLANLSRFEEADSLLAEVAATRRLGFADGSVDVSDLGNSLTELAELRSRRGQFDSAVALAREALDLTLKARGREHHDVAVAAGYLGSQLRKMGAFAAAESLFRESIAIDRRVVGPEHPFLAQSMVNLGLVIEEQGRYAEAQQVDREALQRLRAALGQEHPIVAVALSNLAGALQADGKLDEAMGLRTEALAMNRKLNGPEDESVAVALNNLASLYRLLKRFDDAVPLFEEAHGIFVKVDGPEHPNAVIAMHNIGKTNYDAGRYAEAEARLRAACALAGKIFPPGHPNAAIFASNHGRALLALGRLAEAETLLVGAHAVLEKSLGPTHTRTRETAGALAELYRRTGKPEEAKRWSLRATAVLAP